MTRISNTQQKVGSAYRDSFERIFGQGNSVGKTEHWNNAPDWARWFAIDRNRGGWWYRQQPKPHDGFGHWLLPYKYTINNCNLEYAGRFPVAGVSWLISLEQRPEKRKANTHQHPPSAHTAFGERLNADYYL